MINLDSDLARAHPDWVLGDRRPDAAAVAPPAGARPGPPRRVRLHPRAARRAADRVPDRLPQVGPQPRPARGRPRPDGRARRARPDPRGLPAARRAARAATPAWRSSRARRAACGSTSRSWSTPTGSGAATSSTPWSASRSSAGPRSCCRPSWSAATSAPRARTPPAAPTTCRSAPGPRCSARSASSGTSTAASDAERTELASWVALYKEVRELVHTGDGRARAAARPVVRGARRRRAGPLGRAVRAGPADHAGDLGARRRAAARARPRPPLPRARCSRRATCPPLARDPPRRRGSPRASRCRARCSTHAGLRAPALFPEQLLLAPGPGRRRLSGRRIRATAAAATGSRPAG